MRLLKRLFIGMLTFVTVLTGVGVNAFAMEPGDSNVVEAQNEDETMRQVKETAELEAALDELNSLYEKLVVTREEAKAEAARNQEQSDDEFTVRPIRLVDYADEQEAIIKQMKNIVDNNATLTKELDSMDLSVFQPVPEDAVFDEDESETEPETVEPVVDESTNDTELDMSANDSKDEPETEIETTDTDVEDSTDAVEMKYEPINIEDEMFDIEDPIADSEFKVRPYGYDGFVAKLMTFLGRIFR